jgi:hypothetical protein
MGPGVADVAVQMVQAALGRSTDEGLVLADLSGERFCLTDRVLIFVGSGWACAKVLIDAGLPLPARTPRGALRPIGAGASWRWERLPYGHAAWVPRLATAVDRAWPKGASDPAEPARMVPFDHELSVVWSDKRAVFIDGRVVRILPETARWFTVEMDGENGGSIDMAWVADDGRGVDTMLGIMPIDGRTAEWAQVVEQAASLARIAERLSVGRTQADERVAP